MKSPALPRLIQLITHHQPAIQVRALDCVCLWCQLCTQYCSSDLHRVLLFLSRQFNSLRAVTGLTSEDHDVVSQLIDMGLLEHLLAVLKTNNDALWEDAAWSLGNIAGDCHEYRDLVLEAGGLQSLIDKLSILDLRVPILRVVVWALSNLCRGKPPFEKVRAHLLLVGRSF